MVLNSVFEYNKFDYLESMRSVSGCKIDAILAYDTDHLL